MDQRELVVIGQVGVGIDVGGTAVGGPASVADANRRLVHWVLLKLGGQVGQLAGLLPVLYFTVGDNGDAGRVIAAVLQALEAFHEHVQSGVLLKLRGQAYVTDDSTHEGQHIRCSHGPGSHPLQAEREVRLTEESVR